MMTIVIYHHHQGSGGASIVHLDDGPVRVLVQGGSADQSAAGSKQNAGDATTDKPTTRLHQARGGTSTTCLGSNYPHDTVRQKSSDSEEDANRLASLCL